MRTCPDCLKPVEAGTAFCEFCGYPLKENPVYPISPSPTSILNTRAGVTPVSYAAKADGNLSRRCPSCGFDNLVGEMFCQKCGVQLPSVANAPQPFADPNTPAPGKPQGAAVASDRTSSGGAKPAPPVVRLELKIGAEQVMLSINQGEILIGRVDPALAIYPDIDTSPFEGAAFGVSRRHAKIVHRHQVFYIIDLNSTNFTFLNGKKLKPGQSYPLADGDEIQLGMLAFIYHASNGR